MLHFESAARHLSFTAAAQELGSTQPAVSARIQQLEYELGVPLFTRAHRGVRLTEDGHRLFEAVRQGVDLIEEVVRDLRDRQRQPTLTLATDFGFAAYWLMPRLGALRQEVPELDVRIMTSQSAIDIRDGSVDAAIAFGDGTWPGCVSEKLLPEQVIPVCSPGLASRLTQPGSSPSLPWEHVPLLHLERPHPVRWMDWADWFELAGQPIQRLGPETTFNNYPLVLQGAITGQGVALGWIPLIQDLLQQDLLIPAAPAPIQTQRGYFLVMREQTRLTPTLRVFRNWIMAEGEQARRTSPPPLRRPPTDR